MAFVAPKIIGGWAFGSLHILRVGQNRICAPYMTICMVVSLLRILCNTVYAYDCMVLVIPAVTYCICVLLKYVLRSTDKLGFSGFDQTDLCLGAAAVVWCCQCGVNVVLWNYAVVLSVWCCGVVYVVSMWCCGIMLYGIVGMVLWNYAMVLSVWCCGVVIVVSVWFCGIMLWCCRYGVVDVVSVWFCGIMLWYCRYGAVVLSTWCLCGVVK